ncbi:unnamed protein product, partial [marine sediment metagenome]
LKIHNEKELTSLIETDKFFYEYCDWEPVGGNTDNIRYIGNQQTTAAGTLTEIVVNSIDALLILECIKSGKDPTESGVPQNMNKASEIYFGIPEGIIYKCYPPEVSRLSSSVKTLKNVPIIQLSENINLLFLKSDSKEQINYWKEKIIEVERNGSKGYIGMPYGKKDENAITINLMKSYLPNWETRTLIGKELWDFISEEDNFHEKVIESLKLSALEILNNHTILNEINSTIERVNDEYRQKFGDNVDNYIKSLF